MVLGKINRLGAGFIWRFREMKAGRDKGADQALSGDMKMAPGELEAAF
jgi:hypothetical protein